MPCVKLTTTREQTCENTMITTRSPHFRYRFVASLNPGSVAFRAGRLGVHLLSVVIVVSLANSVSADLIHRWSFEGSTTDSVGGAHASLVGGATVSGGQLQMNGSGQYASLPIDATLSSLNSTTIEAWVTYNALSPWARIFDFGDGDRTAFPTQGYLALTGSPEYTNTVSYAQFTITETTNAASQNIYGGGIPGPGVPLHYAVVLDHVTDTGSLYINGSLLKSETISLSPSDLVANDGVEHNWLGRSRFTQDAYLNGSIDEFRIYNEALDSDQVMDSFQRGVSSVPEPGSFLMFALAGWIGAVRRRRS